MIINLDNAIFYKNEDYTIFEIKNFLPLDIYKKLYSTFPGQEFFKEEYTSKDKQSLSHENQNFNDFVNQNPIWKEFLNSINSQDFIDSAFKKSLIPNFRSRGLKSLKIWKLNKEKKSLLNIFTRKVKVSFHFSRIYDERRIAPHTDASTKFLSFIYYFKDDDWHESEGGNTIFWKTIKNKEKWNNWSNKHMSDDTMNSFCLDNLKWKESKFEANKLVGFIKSSRSWHSVEKIKPKNGHVRKVLNFFIRRAD